MKRIIELDIVDLAYNGKAVGYLDGKVTFVNGGLPGERVEVRLSKTKKRYNQAKLLRVITKSPERIDPVCQHYDICGGCTWQDLAYERQLHYKRNQVIASLEHIGGFDDVAVDDIHPSPDQYFYRNKMEYSFHVVPEDPDHNFVFGLHERGRFDSIFDIEYCHLQSEMSNQLVQALRKLVRDLNIPVYDLIRHRGFIRFAIIREGKNTGQTMLTIVTADGDFQDRDEFVAALVQQFPDLTTIVRIINKTITNIAKGDVTEVLHGPGFIEETLLGLKFRINPAAFFQTNSRQTERLYQAAIDMADLSSDDVILDLYCGAGAIGLCAAAQVKEVIGIDIETEAIDAARVNADINGIDSARFYAGTVRDILLQDDLRNKAYDPVFIDPPRAGMHPKAMQRLLEIDPRRIVYISCNPATFARDAKDLTAAGYTLKKIVPLDMFPHTMHIELVSRFEKNA